MRGRRIEIVDGMKPCSKCGETKPVAEFGANLQSPSGLTSYCKPCLAEKARALRADPEAKKRHYEATKRWIDRLPQQQRLTEGFKVCPKCETEKAFDLFPRNRRGKHGVGTYCLTCSADMVRARRNTEEGAQAHRDASKRWRDTNVGRNKDNNARWRYGIDPGTYDAMLLAQGGKCKICLTTEPGKGLTRFPIDHCHTTKKVRGLLCEHCNKGLGHFRDDPDLMVRGADYLRSTKGS